MFLHFSALQKFMATYEQFYEWLNTTSSNVAERIKTKHSVGVTESKLEEHKVSLYGRVCSCEAASACQVARALAC